MAKLMPALVAEAIGVFALSFIGIMAIHSFGGVPGGLIGIALAHGLILAIMISAFGAISGGHINPAVTIGLLVGGKIKPGPAAAYIVAQIVGGVLAGVLVMAIYGSSNGATIVVEGTPKFSEAAPTVVSVATPAAQTQAAAISPMTPTGAMLAEAVATFFLVIAVWGTAVDPRAPKIGGFGIGLTVAADILAIGPLTGAAMNPARAFGPALAAMMGGAKYEWGTHWIYWVGPILGGIVASLIYKGVIWDKDAK